MADPGPLWTVEEACTVFAAQGLPVNQVRLKRAIWVHQVKPAGWMPSGESGGRGKARYRVDDLMYLHADIMRWDERNASR